MSNPDMSSTRLVRLSQPLLQQVDGYLQSGTLQRPPLDMIAERSERRTDQDLADRIVAVLDRPSTKERVPMGVQIKSFVTIFIPACIFSISILLPAITSYAAAQASQLEAACPKWLYLGEDEGSGNNIWFKLLFYQALWTQMIGTILILRYSQFQTCPNCDIVLAVLLGKLGATFIPEILKNVESIEEAGSWASDTFGADTRETDPRRAKITLFLVCAYVLWLNVIVTFIIGILLYKLGKKKCVSYLQFLPFPVVAGFLGGVFLATAQAALTLGLGSPILEFDWADPTALIRIPLIISYVFLTRWMKSKHRFGSAICVMMVAISFYCVKTSRAVYIPNKHGISEVFPPADWYFHVKTEEKTAAASASPAIVESISSATASAMPSAMLAAHAVKTVPSSADTAASVGGAASDRREIEGDTRSAIENEKTVLENGTLEDPLHHILHSPISNFHKVMGYGGLELIKGIVPSSAMANFIERIHDPLGPSILQQYTVDNEAQLVSNVAWSCLSATVFGLGQIFSLFCIMMLEFSLNCIGGKKVMDPKIHVHKVDEDKETKKMGILNFWNACLGGIYSCQSVQVSVAMKAVSEPPANDGNGNAGGEGGNRASSKYGGATNGTGNGATNGAVNATEKCANGGAAGDKNTTINPENSQHALANSQKNIASGEHDHYNHNNATGIDKGSQSRLSKFSSNSFSEDENLAMKLSPTIKFMRTQHPKKKAKVTVNEWAKYWPSFIGVPLILAYFHGAQILLDCLPTFIIAGVLLDICYDLAIEWIIVPKSKIASAEWYALLLTASLVLYDVNVGVVTGLLFTLLIFVAEYSGITGIAAEGNLSDSRSTVDRSEVENEVLQQQADAVKVYWLHGYLFFGSSLKLQKRIVNLVKERRDNMATPLAAILLDFSLVPAMDANGVFCLVETAEELQELDPPISLILCGLVRRLRNALKRADVKDHLMFRRNLDLALETCEKKVLVKHEEDQAHIFGGGMRQRIPGLTSLDPEDSAIVGSIVDSRHVNMALHRPNQGKSIRRPRGTGSGSEQSSPDRSPISGAGHVNLTSRTFAAEAGSLLSESSPQRVRVSARGINSLVRSSTNLTRSKSGGHGNDLTSVWHHLLASDMKSLTRNLDQHSIQILREIPKDLAAVSTKRIYTNRYLKSRLKSIEGRCSVVSTTTLDGTLGPESRGLSLPGDDEDFAHIFQEGDPIKELRILADGELEIISKAQKATNINLPRYHLNSEKGDKYVFEMAEIQRERVAKPGAVFGAQEYVLWSESLDSAGGFSKSNSPTDASGTSLNSGMRGAGGSGRIIGDSIRLQAVVEGHDSSSSDKEEDGHHDYLNHNTWAMCYTRHCTVISIPFTELRKAEQKIECALLLRMWISKLCCKGMSLCGVNNKPSFETITKMRTMGR